MAELLAYTVTIKQEHSASYIIRAPSPAEAERVAKRRWERGDYERHQPLHTWSSGANRAPAHDNEPIPDECICPTMIGRMIDPQSWCPVHGDATHSLRDVGDRL